VQRGEARLIEEFGILLVLEQHAITNQIVVELESKLEKVYKGVSSNKMIL